MEDARAIKQQFDDVAKLVSEQLIGAFAEAAEDEELWTKVATDVNAFLGDRGINLPTGSQ